MVFTVHFSFCLFLSQVKQHKTKEAFGLAQIPLTKNEYMWLNRFVYHRHKFPCGDSNIFFSNSNGGTCHDLLEAFQKCWKNFGLPEKPTFSLIRSSISTCVRFIFFNYLSKCYYFLLLLLYQRLLLFFFFTHFIFVLL